MRQLQLWFSLQFSAASLPTFSIVDAKYYWKKDTILSDGYFVSFIGNVSTNAAENYILNKG